VLGASLNRTDRALNYFVLLLLLQLTRTGKQAIRRIFGFFLVNKTQIIKTLLKRLAFSFGHLQAHQYFAEGGAMIAVME